MNLSIASIIRKIISYTLYYSGVTHLVSRLGNNKVIILAYHRVIDVGPDFEFDPDLVNANMKTFEMQMEYLSKRYNVISLEDFLDHCRKKKAFQKNTVVITFDDGYKDNYQYAYPTLRKYKFPATIFLSIQAIEIKELFWWDKIAYMINKTKMGYFELESIGTYSLGNRMKTLGRIESVMKKLDDDKKNILIAQLSKILNVKLPRRDMFLSWSQVIEMGKNGISFGAHTLSHPILTKISLYDAKKEILGSKRLIEMKTNKETTLFAYPNGLETDFNEEIINILRRNGFDCAVTYIPGWNDINSKLYRLNRVFVKYEDDMMLFKNKMVGLDIVLSKLYHIFTRY